MARALAFTAPARHVSTSTDPSSGPYVLAMTHDADRQIPTSRLSRR
jgi:hypothetical protein